MILIPGLEVGTGTYILIISNPNPQLYPQDMVYFARKAARFHTEDRNELAGALVRITAFCETECAHLLALLTAFDDGGGGGTAAL